MGMSGALAELAAPSARPSVYLRHDLLGTCDLQVPFDGEKCRTLHDLRREASLRFCKVLGMKKGMEEGNPPVIAAFTTKTGEILSDFMSCTNLKDGQVVVAHLTAQAEKLMAPPPSSKSKGASRKPPGMIDYVECYFRDLDPRISLWLPIVGITTVEELCELAERLLSVRFPHVHIVRFRDENAVDIPSHLTLEEAKIKTGVCVEAVDASEDEARTRAGASPRRTSISTGAKKIAHSILSRLPGSPTFGGAAEGFGHGDSTGNARRSSISDADQTSPQRTALDHLRRTTHDGSTTHNASLDMESHRSLDFSHFVPKAVGKGPTDKGTLDKSSFDKGSVDKSSASPTEVQPGANSPVAAGSPTAASSSRESEGDHHVDSDSQLASPMGAVTPVKGRNRISRLLQRFHQPEGGHFTSMDNPTTTSAPTTPH
eukprot:jgi/Mesvir1/23785/Mv10606-RA.1